MGARRRLGTVLVGAALGVLAAYASACGPSFQAIYEGNARFEHCYALEENPQAPMKEKGDCWRDWSEHYTYGQTRDRIQYAIARYVALSQTENVPTDEAMMNAAPGVTPRISNITAPAPTNAFAPPPKVLGEGDATVRPPLRPSERPQVITNVFPQDGGAAPAPVRTFPPPPGQECGDRCHSDFDGCSRSCGADAGANGNDGGAKRCGDCEKTYKKCMRACFK
jgi:hypothetical protein